MMTLIQVLLAIMVLIVMVLLLCGVSHLFSGEFRDEARGSERLRRDIRERDEVITRENVFRAFLDPQYVRDEDHRHHRRK